MSADTAGGPGAQAAGPGGGSGEPSEQELRAAYEAELSRITATDMMAQAAVTLLNIGARRLEGPGGGPAGGPDAAGVQGAAAQGAGAQGASAERSQRDLEQARDAIDGARALLDILERRIPQELGPLRDALARLQMAYAREVREVPGERDAGHSEPEQAGAEAAGQTAPAAPGQEPAPSERPDTPGPAEASGRLWVPGR